MPSRTKNNVYIQPRLATRQLQPVEKSSSVRLVQTGAFGMARDNGSQNTLKP